MLANVERLCDVGEGHVGQYFKVTPEQAETMETHLYLDADGYGYVLLRNDMVHAIRVISQRIRQNKPFPGFVLYGPGGCGKSMLLWLLSIMLEELECIVLRLDSTNLEPRLFLESVIKLHHDNGDFLFSEQQMMEVQDALKSFDKSQRDYIASEVFLLLKSCSPGNYLCILIDQWNFVFNDDMKDSQFFKVLNNFSNIRSLRSGFSICAVSSSFDPVAHNAFRDADRMFFMKFISPYSEQELAVVLEFFHQRNLIPPETVSDIIQYYSGNVPRFIYLLGLISSNNENMEVILRLFQKAMMEHYLERLSSLLKKYGSRDNFSFLVQFFRNESIDKLPRSWQITGMFLQSIQNGKWLPICPAVKEAIWEFTTSKRKETVEILAQDCTTRWRAFELLFSSQFIPSGGAMSVRCCDLKGQNEETVQIQVIKFVEQPENDDLGDIEPGTLIVCRKYFPVVDFFIHSMSGLKFFVQISESKYQNHPAKFADLFSSIVSPGEEKKQESVFEYFYTRSKGSSRKRKRTSKSLPGDCMYLYFTTLSRENAIQTRVSHTHASVRLVFKEHLEELGELWHLPTLYTRN